MTEKYVDEGEKPEMSKKDKDELDMETAQKDEDLETETGREEQLEDDAITPAEQGFMKGEAEATDLEKDSEEDKKEE
tara:strand:- start:15117 stop:15347 length:231 start_codon:yes stop_codon:yes gene_type:complete